MAAGWYAESFAKRHGTPFSIPTQPASAGAVGTVGPALDGAGTQPFGHQAGLVSAVMLIVHLLGAVLHAPVDNERSGTFLSVEQAGRFCHLSVTDIIVLRSPG